MRINSRVPTTSLASTIARQGRSASKSRVPASGISHSGQSTMLKSLRFSRRVNCCCATGWLQNKNNLGLDRFVLFRAVALASIARAVPCNYYRRKRWLLYQAILEFADANAAIAGGDLKQRTPSVQLAANSRALDGAFHRHRYVELDVSVAGMGVELSGKILRQPRFHSAIAGVDDPSVIHLRAGTHGQVNVAITGAQIQACQHTVDGHVAVAGVSIQRTVEIAHFNVAIASIELGLARGAVNADVSIAGVQVQRGFRRNQHLDAHSAMRADMNAPTAGDVDLQVNLVGVLVLDDAHAAAADAVAIGNDPRRNGAAYAARNFN